MDLPIQLPADLTKVETMSQGKIRLIFVSQELVPNDIKARFLSQHEQMGWLSFLPGEKNITAEMLVDLPEIEKREEETKSPSQRLRAALFILWTQRGKPTDTFEQFYLEHLEKFINAVKEKLT